MGQHVPPKCLLQQRVSCSCPSSFAVSLFPSISLLEDLLRKRSELVVAIE